MLWWKRNRKESPDSKHIDTKETIKYSRVGIKVKIRRKINMAKRGGFPGMGMPGNMNNLMKQAQKMQRQMEENQKELEEKEFTAAAGGGAVEVTISGKREITKVKLSEEVVDPDDIEMLEDLIVAATNEALRKVEEESSAVMSKLAGGLGGLGGGFPF
jgi:DNA-binding YbaB/EbfC family protein